MVIVQAKTFVPIPNPVTELVGESEFEITPVPETKVQAPTPTEGKFPFKVVVGEEMQSVWFEPAVAIVGTCLTVIVTFETDAAQGGLEIVQAKTLFPKPNPVIAVVGESELEITPVPETRVQAPVPTVGVLAVIKVLGLVTHNV